MEQIHHFGARPTVRHIAAARIFGIEPAAPVFAIVKRQKFVAARCAFEKSAGFEFIIEQRVQTRPRLVVQTKSKSVVNLCDLKISPQILAATLPGLIQPISGKPSREFRP